MDDSSWEVQSQRERLTSPCIRCDVPDGLDLALSAWKPKINSLCNLGNFCTCWATACFTWRQCCGLDDHEIMDQFLLGKGFLLSSNYPNSRVIPTVPPIQSLLRVKRLGQETNLFSLSSARVKNIRSCVVCSTSTPLYWHIRLAQTNKSSVAEHKQTQNFFLLKPDTWTDSSGKPLNWKCTHITWTEKMAWP